MGGMGKLSKAARKKADGELSEVEGRLLRDTQVDLESLRTKISDEESFNQLIKAVKASTARNESIAQLKQRLLTLGEGVAKVAKEVIDIIK